MIQQSYFWVILKNSNQGLKEVFVHSHKHYLYVVPTYNGKLFSLKNEGNPIRFYNVYELWGHYAVWNKQVARRQISYDSTYTGYLE